MVKFADIAKTTIAYDFHNEVEMRKNNLKLLTYAIKSSPAAHVGSFLLRPQGGGANHVEVI